MTNQSIARHAGCPGKIRRICFYTLLFMLSLCAETTAQIQVGKVKTRGRMVQGVLHPGKGIADATICISGRTDIKTMHDGTFSFPARSTHFRLENVIKKGYVLTDMDICSQHRHSTDTFFIVMETPERRQTDLLAAERTIRHNLQDQLRAREQQIETLNISIEEKERMLSELYKQQGDNERLISNMARRYATLDYDQLDEFYKQVGYCIESGALSKADSLLRTKGDLHAQVNEQIEKRSALQDREEQLQRAKHVYHAENEELSNRCYSFYEASLVRHDIRQAAHYLDLRCRLDTANINWKSEAGLFYQNYLADYVTSMQYLKSALREARRKGDRTGEGRAHINLGILFNTLGDDTRALEHYIRALAALKHEADSQNMARAYNSIGNIYQEQNLMSNARKYYRQALNFINAAHNPELDFMKAMIHQNIGLSYLHSQPEKALECFQKALEMCRADTGDTDGDFRLASVCLNMGNAYQNTGKCDVAISLYQKALTLWTQEYGEVHPYTAKCLSAICSAHIALGNYEQAHGYCDSALAIREKIFDSDHPDIDVSLTNKTDLYHAELNRELNEAWNGSAADYRAIGKKAEEFVRFSRERYRRFPNQYARMAIAESLSLLAEAQVHTDSVGKVLPTLIEAMKISEFANNSFLGRLNRLNARIYSVFALYYAGKGQREHAAGAIRKALQLSPGDTHLQDISQKILHTNTDIAQRP